MISNNTKSTTPSTDLVTDFVYLAKLATEESYQDIRLLLAKLVRKYRGTAPALAAQLDATLRASQLRSAGPAVLRKQHFEPGRDGPVDADSRLELIRIVDTGGHMDPPILPAALMHQISSIVREHVERAKLDAHGISPTRSAMLVGPPGVGKTLTAQWIAHSLGKPLWVLDLAAVMSSLLGKTGANIRAALNHAKANQAVLLLDEVDAIAKRRSDGTDVGELKRLVAVILQEVDQWPDTSLLLGATNHPELVDPALWRRFDALLQFELPQPEALEVAIAQFMGTDYRSFKSVAGFMSKEYAGQSLSDVKRAIASLRRAAVFEGRPMHSLVEDVVGDRASEMSRAERLEYAAFLVKSGTESHHEISKKTGIARDTLRKHFGPSTNTRRGRK